MQITVYLDIIFLVQFIIILFVLYFTAILIREHIVIWKMICAAFFGAGILLPFIQIPHLLIGKNAIIVSFIISIGTVLIAFGIRKGFWKKWFLSTTIMIFLSGVMNYLRYAFCIQSLTFLIWIGFFLLSVLTIYFIFIIINEIVHHDNYLYLIKLQHGKHSVTDYVYLDTGNMLWDPYFLKPVILIDESMIKKLMTEEEILLLDTYKKKGYIDYEKGIEKNREKQKCFHEIPYKCVGKISGKLLCFLVEDVYILDLDKRLKNQPIAIVTNQLFFGKKYRGLLNRECI